MRYERIVILILLVIIAVFVFDKTGLQIVKQTEAQTKIGGREITVRKIYSKEVRSEQIYTNAIFVLGYDLLKLHEKTLNILISKDYITTDEGKKILQSTKTKVITDEVKK